MTQISPAAAALIEDIRACGSHIERHLLIYSIPIWVMYAATIVAVAFLVLRGS